MLKNVLTKVLGDPNQKTIDRLTPLVEEVNALEADMQRRCNDELRQMMADFRADIARATSSVRSQLEESRNQRDVASGDERRPSGSTEGGSNAGSARDALEIDTKSSARTCTPCIRPAALMFR